MTYSYKQKPFDPNVLVPEKSTRLFSVLSYTDNEIQKARGYLLDYPNYPSMRETLALLEATLTFRCATAQEEDFIEARKRNKKEGELKQILEEMSKALSKADLYLKTLPPQSDNALFFKSVIDYCQTSILKQAHEMEMHHDIIYEKFWNNSSLHGRLGK